MKQQKKLGIRKYAGFPAIAVAAVTLLGASVQAATTINVNWVFTPFAGSTFAAPYSGQGILAATGNTWNNFEAGNASFSSLVNSEGAATSVGLTVSGSNSKQAFGVGTEGDLTRVALGGTSSNVTTVTITGLAEGTYKVAAMGVRATNDGGNTNFTIGTTTLTAGTPQGTAGSTSNTAPASWAVYDTVTVDDQGILVISARPGPSPSFGQSYTNAIQIQAVPEPSAPLLLGTGLVAMTVFNRRRLRR